MRLQHHRERMASGEKEPFMEAQHAAARRLSMVEIAGHGNRRAVFTLAAHQTKPASTEEIAEQSRKGSERYQTPRDAVQAGCQHSIQ